MPIKKSSDYHFFLSEFKKTDEPTLGLIVELMRAAQHIKDIRRLIVLLSSDGLGEEEGVVHQLEYESLQTMVLNMTAAQLREALKVYWKLSETNLFKSLIKKFSKKELGAINELLEMNSEFSKKTGFIYQILEPVRNLMFHYQIKREDNKVVKWIQKIKEYEKYKKPPVQFINLKDFNFGPGFEYERSIYADYLFWGDSGLKKPMRWQERVWNTQITFLLATQAIIKKVLSNEKIEIRELGWVLKYHYGYKD